MKLELDSMQRVTDEQQLKQIFESERAVIFKHSTRCPISAHAFSEMERFHQGNPDIRFFVVHVVEDEPLSDYVTRNTGVRHESPQLLLLERGTVRWHASHFDVAASSLERRLGITTEPEP